MLTFLSVFIVVFHCRSSTCCCAALQLVLGKFTKTMFATMFEVCGHLHYTEQDHNFNAPEEAQGLKRLGIDLIL